MGALFAAHISEILKTPGILPPLSVWLTMAVHFTLIAGYFLAWKWERLGPIMVIVSSILFFGTVNSEEMLPLVALTTAPAWALLVCNWWTRREESEYEPRRLTAAGKTVKYVLIGVPSLLALLFVIEIFTHRGTEYTAETFPSDIVGTWRGTTAVTPRISDKRGWVDVEVIMTVSPDGGVTGMVGNAHFFGAQVLKNRTWFYRKINFYSDHIVRGYLEGGVLLGDPVPRKTIMIPFNVRDGVLTGGIQALLTKSFVPMGAHLKLEKD